MALVLPKRKRKIMQDKFESVNVRELPPNVYIVERPNDRGSLPTLHRLMNRSDVLDMSGRYHYLVCGDIGYVVGGNMILWMLHTEGPLVDYIRQSTGNHNAVSFVGFVLVTQPGTGTVYHSVSGQKECTMNYKVESMCITPAYRKQQHGKQLWSAMEHVLIVDALETQIRLAPQCDKVVAINIFLEATVEYVQQDELSKYYEEHAEEKDAVKELEVIRMYTGGGWKFWERLGFTSKGLVMGSMRMSKTVLIPSMNALVPVAQQYSKKSLSTRQLTRKRKDTV